MKFYKIVNPEGHNGLIYHEGINTDPQKFNPSGNCVAGGIYFAREDIFAFLGYGTDLYEVEPVGDEVYENPSKDGEAKKWKAKQLNMKYIGKVIDNIPFLVEQGANIHANNESALRYAAKKGDLDVVKYLVENGADIHDNDERALRLATEKGHINIVKYLVENGADIHADDDYALRCAANNGQLDVVKYLLESGCDIHAENDSALCWAAVNGHLGVVKYLVENDANIHGCNDSALRLAAENGHLEVVKYLVEQGANIKVLNCWIMNSIIKKCHMDVIDCFLNHKSKLSKKIILKLFLKKIKLKVIKYFVFSVKNGIFEK